MKLVYLLLLPLGMAIGSLLTGLVFENRRSNCTEIHTAQHPIVAHKEGHHFRKPHHFQTPKVKEPDEPSRIPKGFLVNDESRKLFKTIKRGSPLLVTFGSVAMSDFVFNWVEHVKRLDTPLSHYVVASLDRPLLDLCHSKGIPAIAMSTDGGLMNYTEYFRANEKKFLEMGNIKTDIIRGLLVEGYHIIICDADVVLFRNPWPFFLPEEARKQGRDFYYRVAAMVRADVLSTTDCLDEEEDTEQRRWLMNKEFNTGILFFRGTNFSIDVVDKWKERIAVEKEMKLYINDQAVFNRAFHNVGPYTPLQVPEQADPPPARPPNQKWWDGTGMRSVYHMLRVDGLNPNTTIGVLPMVEFLNGHSFFVTQLHKKYNTKPVALHATYQFGDTPEYSYGKRERLRQAGIWWIENDQFYEGNYLVINGDMMEGFNASDVALRAWEPVEPHLFAKTKDPTGTGDGGVSLHLQADALQRRRLQDAFALAHLLGRTLVLPTLKCHCDRYWWLLHGCRTPGAERMPLPYECPMDHVFEPSMWFKANLHFRQAGFLESSRLPKAVLNSRAKLPQNLCKCQSETGNEEKLAMCEHEYWGTLRADDSLEYAAGEGKVATHGQTVRQEAYHLHPMTMPESTAVSPEDAKLKQARILEVDVKALDTLCWSGNDQFDRSMRAALDMHTGFCPRELNTIPPNWKPETHPLNCSWGYSVPSTLGAVSKERRENMKQAYI